MECKFVTNGLAIDYHGTVKPCCAFAVDSNFRRQNHVSCTDLTTWFDRPDILELRDQLAKGNWPQVCRKCQMQESTGRGDSMRLNGISAYGDFGPDDITLEIRGGTTCNLACQTCWPDASSRVVHFYRKAGLEAIEPPDLDWNYDALLPIKHRIRNIVLLGGEPFYDKRCLRFLSWLQQHDIKANLVIFTNGTVIDHDFVRGYAGPITLTFSMDAMGLPAHYIRYGCDWSTVQKNFEACRKLPGLDLRVNITTSPYNYIYLEPLVTWLSQDWPDLVTFGIAGLTDETWFMTEDIIPFHKRGHMIESLGNLLTVLDSSRIPDMQKHNAVNAIKSIQHNLKTLPFDAGKYQHFKRFVADMDRVKKMQIRDYCPEVADYFEIQ